MTLTHRLILLVIAIVMTMLASGAYYAIDFTRNNISDEVRSSARLTMQLMTAALISGSAENQPQEQQILISHLQQLDDIRHLNIAVVRSDGTIIYPFSERRQRPRQSVPSWFIDLVKPPPAEYRKRIASPLIGTSEIVILADPLDEIQDAWQEARSIVFLIVVFTLLCIVLMAIIIRRSLRPVNQISAGLGVIQSGTMPPACPISTCPNSTGSHSSSTTWRRCWMTNSGRTASSTSGCSRCRNRSAATCHGSCMTSWVSRSAPSRRWR